MTESLKGRGEGIDQLTALGPKPEPPKKKLQPCACCGEPSTSRWCSTYCFVQEDGFGDPENYR